MTDNNTTNPNPSPSPNTSTGTHTRTGTDTGAATGADARAGKGAGTGSGAVSSPTASRRTVLLAAGSAALLTACTAPDRTHTTAAQHPTTPPPSPAASPSPACVLAVRAGTGPYYLDLNLIRSDITQDRDGVPLRLDLTVVRVPDGCRPLPNASIEVWHADANGEYSTGNNTYLRGTQITDHTGHCVFHTIVPGWYAGLAPHIHFTVRPAPHTHTTSQFYFPENLLTTIYTRPPYSRRTPPTHPNARDYHYRTAGTPMTLPLTPDTTGGYHTTYTIGIT